MSKPTHGRFKRLISRSLFLILAAAASGSMACTSSPTAADDVSVIRATTSFGFCLGYCKTTLEITSDQLVYVEEATRSGELPPVRRTAAVAASEWEALVAALDRSKIESLPETLGCPDCADGGAESIEVVGPDWRKSVTFEFGATIPELQPLLDRVRTLRSRFTPTPR
jgi:hypothetical protein